MLKQVLVANATFSAGAALAMLIAPHWLEPHVPLPRPAWLGLGIGLLLFALQLALMAARPALARKLTPQAIAADWAWVGLTTIAMFAGWRDLSATGVALVLAVNAIVAAFAILQQRGYRALPVASAAALTR